MPFDWSSLENQSESILLKFGDEGCKRSAVSRMYYCAFNLVRRWLNKEKKLNRYLDNAGSLSKNDHFNTATSLEDAGFPNEAVLLNTLRVVRNNCDYTDDVPDLDNEVANAKIATKLILAVVPKPYALTGFPPRP